MSLCCTGVDDKEEEKILTEGRKGHEEMWCTSLFEDQGGN
jgi:hypothetical protein